MFNLKKFETLSWYENDTTGECYIQAFDAKASVDGVEIKIILTTHAPLNPSYLKDIEFKPVGGVVYGGQDEFDKISNWILDNKLDFIKNQALEHIVKNTHFIEVL